MNHTSQSIRQSVLQSASGLIGPVLCAALVVGCSQNETSPKYQVVDEARVISVTAADFGVDSSVFDQVGKHALMAEPTQGQFPSGMCVTQIEAFKNESDQRKLRIVLMPSQHAIYWNHLFDELPSIREVVFLGKPGLDPRGCQRDDILNVALARDCELCLIYARVEETDADAEYAGILWNTRTRTAMATVRTPVILPIQVAAELKEDPNCDRAIAEADFRSEQDFRRMVRDLMWDIASHDVADAGKDTNPWKNYVPPMPPMYDRYRFPQFEKPVPYNSPGVERRKETRKTSTDDEAVPTTTDDVLKETTVADGEHDSEP